MRFYGQADSRISESDLSWKCTVIKYGFKKFSISFILSLCILATSVYSSNTLPNDVDPAKALVKPFQHNESFPSSDAEKISPALPELLDLCSKESEQGDVLFLKFALDEERPVSERVELIRAISESARYFWKPFEEMKLLRSLFESTSSDDGLHAFKRAMLYISADVCVQFGRQNLQGQNAQDFINKMHRVVLVGGNLDEEYPGEVLGTIALHLDQASHRSEKLDSHLTALFESGVLDLSCFFQASKRIPYVFKDQGMAQTLRKAYLSANASKNRLLTNLRVLQLFTKKSPICKDLWLSLSMDFVQQLQNDLSNFSIDEEGNINSLPFLGYIHVVCKFASQESREYFSVQLLKI